MKKKVVKKELQFASTNGLDAHGEVFFLCFYVETIDDVHLLVVGPHHELTSHQENCIHPKKSGAEVMDILRLFDEDLEKEKKVYHNIFELLNYEKITFNGNLLIE